MTPAVLHVRVTDPAGGTLAEGQAAFGASSAGLRNAREVRFPALQHGTAVWVELRSVASAAPFARLSAGPMPIRQGDHITFPAGSLKLQLDGPALDLSPLLAPAPSPDLVSLLAKTPDATPQQIWDAAFMAGVEMTTTLLGGTRE